jgi:hypothetical protein
VSRFPVAFRLPAFASRVILSPLGDWASLAVGLPGGARTPSGFHVSHARVATGEGALSTPGTTVLTRPIASLRPPPAASQRQCPYTPAEHPSSGAKLDEASLRVHCIHPSGLPLACGPRMERGPLGFSPELRTPPLPATHVRVGTGLEHWPGTTQSTSSVDPPSYKSTRIVRPRVAPRESCMRPERIRRTSETALAARSALMSGNCERSPGPDWATDVRPELSDAVGADHRSPKWLGGVERPDPNELSPRRRATISVGPPSADRWIATFPRGLQALGVLDPLRPPTRHIPRARPAD